jgi:RNA polymerase sigma-70 factor (ECF subfamily)
MDMARPIGPASDADIAAAQAGDTDAFSRLYRATQPGLLRYLTVIAGADAEDICAEAWLNACRDLSRFRGDLNGFRGWIARIARNRAIDLARARQRRPAIAMPIQELPEVDADASSEDMALQAMSTETALNAIASLPRDQAEAVMLRVVLGLDAKTAATVLGKRAGAVRTAAYRGVRTLAARYEVRTTDAEHGTTSNDIALARGRQR